MANFKAGQRIVFKINATSDSGTIVKIGDEDIVKDPNYHVAGSCKRCGCRNSFVLLTITGCAICACLIAPIETQHTSCYGSSEIAHEFVEVQEGIEKIKIPKKQTA